MLACLSYLALCMCVWKILFKLARMIMTMHWDSCWNEKEQSKGQQHGAGGIFRTLFRLVFARGAPFLDLFFYSYFLWVPSCRVKKHGIWSQLRTDGLEGITGRLAYFKTGSLWANVFESFCLKPLWKLSFCHTQSY